MHAMTRRAAAVCLLLLPVLLLPPAAAAQTFATPDEAAAALADAARAGNPDAIARLLGPGSAKLVRSGDAHADAAERQRFVAAYDEQHAIATTGPGHAVLHVGKGAWPLPIPLVEADGRWHFDTAAGAQELVNRRIGRNEIAAIRTALAYVDAQKAFHAMTEQMGDPQYACRLVSSPGRHDGLYWPAEDGQPASPLEPLVAQAREEGYPVDTSAGKPRPYHGYYFRILAGQGANSPQGTRDYVENGRMTRGFALVAWPASYGASGIMSFVVNQDGVVFQKDLGPQTAAVAAAMTRYDPDLSWTRVDVVD